MEEKTSRYCGARAIEYLFNADIDKYFFSELNLCLQVEYPVTKGIACIHARVVHRNQLQKNDDLSSNNNIILFMGPTYVCTHYYIPIMLSNPGLFDT